MELLLILGVLAGALAGPRTLAGAVALRGAVPVPGAVPDSALCSLMPFPPTRGAGTTYLLAEALPDTVLAGPGDVRPSDLGGHWGRGADRDIHGQLLRVERFGGVDSAAVAEAFARTGSREVIAVPWDYDPSCRPVVWSRSARWTEPGLTGFYTLALRPRDGWVDGRPTFDAFTADTDPYPHALMFRRGHMGADAARGPDALTPAEYLELYRHLPTHSELETGRAAAVARLRSWVEANPERARRPPAPEVLRFYRELQP